MRKISTYLLAIFFSTLFVVSAIGQNSNPSYIDLSPLKRPEIFVPTVSVGSRTKDQAYVGVLGLLSEMCHKEGASRNEKMTIVPDDVTITCPSVCKSSDARCLPAKDLSTPIYYNYEMFPEKEELITETSFLSKISSNGECEAGQSVSIYKYACGPSYTGSSQSCEAIYHCGEGQNPIKTANKGYSSILLDVETGNVMHARNVDALRFPGSLTKVMTLYLSYDALNSGVLSLKEPLVVSNHAASAPPIKLGVSAGDSLTVQQAVQAVAVRNANDISVVLAERIGGSEEGFVSMMNAKAAELGMNNTNFTNSHGLPDPKQYTTAGDMAKLASAMVKNHRQYYQYFGQKTFTHDGVSRNNGNKLLHSVCGVDGLVTSYTRVSGYNQIISASRENSRVIAVVIGGATGEARDKHIEDLVERGFDILGAPECVVTSDGVIATHFQPGDVGYEEAVDLAAHVKERRSSHEVLTENNALKLELENARLKAELQTLKSTAGSEDVTPNVLLSGELDTTNSTRERAQSASDNSSNLEPEGQKAYIVYVMDDGRPCTVVPKRKYYNSEIVETIKIWYFVESKSSQRFHSGIGYRVRGTGDDLSFSYEHGETTIGDGHAKFCVHEFTDFESPEKFSKFVSQPLHSATIAGAKKHMYDELAKDYVIHKSLKAACEAFSATVTQSNYKHNAHCVGGLD